MGGKYLKYTLFLQDEKLWMLFKIFQGSDNKYEENFGAQGPLKIPPGICLGK